jgi:hypothetical protein
LAAASVTVVAGPWNFPYAIPLSGLVHAIAARRRSDLEAGS